MIRIASLTLVLAAAGATLAAPLPVEHFSDRSQIGSIVLSPNGRDLAVLGNFGKHGYGLYLIEVDSMKPRQLLRADPKNWVSSVRWLDDQWLTFNVSEEYGFWVGYGRLDKDVGHIKGGNWWVADDCSYLGTVSAPPRRDGTAWVMCGGRMGADVKMQNLKSGYLEMVARNPDRLGNFKLDHQGRVRAASKCEETPEAQVCTSYYRDAPDQPWTPIARWRTGEAGAISPAGFDYDDRRLFVYANPNGGTWGLYAWDTATRTLGAPLFHHPQFDVSGIELSRAERKVVGVHYDDGRARTHWIDAKRAALERDLAAEFPGEVVSVSFSDDGGRALVYVWSDRNPGEWHLYLADRAELRFLAKRRPWIDPAQMAKVEPISFLARDGLRIHGFLTLPPQRSTERMPLIVNPHGGPFGIRDFWGYDPETQFLASRGYAVLQVNFRGSGGYGMEFEKAGWGEWGLKMQDDVTDGVRWAIAQGYADAGRVCIYGASYGGYAALMGLIKTPELYRCGIDYVGVSNLVRLYEDGTQKWAGWDYYNRQRFGWMKRAVGGRWGDSQALSEISPVHQAARIQAPLLVVHGQRDYTVPVIHAYELRSALEEHDKRYEWYLDEWEGHGFRKPDNVRELYRRMEAFLGEHLAPAPAGQAAGR
jgi:dipeptidyl aminopeptidase/acylaminoacyl peptidase